MDGITFIGTATMIVRLGSFTVLTDPNFLHRGQRAYLGRGLWSRRLTEPAMQPADLPTLNAVVLSHLHGDHFDRIARRQLDRAVPVVTTEHAASRLRRYGFTSHGLQPWTRYELTNGDESLMVESLPAVHAYGVLGKLLPPVMGSLLVHRVAGAVRRHVYISGDTLTGEHLDEIREQHPEDRHCGSPPRGYAPTVLDRHDGRQPRRGLSATDQAPSGGSSALRRLPSLPLSAVGIPFRDET
jgi:L-ascorbate metabolism protein UlaG (beta-lactamase superfamily)